MDQQHHIGLSAVRDLINYIGEPDPLRPGLEGTPERVLAAWRADWGRGYHEAPPDLKFFLEPETNFDQMILVRDLVIYSHCEHHLAPFYGYAHIGYIPRADYGILGLSKFARVVEHFARRLQVQERLTQQIAEYLMPHVGGVGVTIHCKHLCMISRGVKQPNSVATTSVLLGSFRDSQVIREEFLSLTRSHNGF